MALVGRIRVSHEPDVPEHLSYRVLETRCLLCGHKDEHLYLADRERILVFCNCYAPENVQPVTLLEGTRRD
jgi:hypothetical protein